MLFNWIWNGAIYAGNIELLNFLLSKGIVVDSQSDSGTPLVWAAGHGQQEAVKILLENSANVSVYLLGILILDLFLF